MQDITRIPAEDFARLCHNEMCREIVLGKWGEVPERVEVAGGRPSEPVLWNGLEEGDRVYLIAVARRILANFRREE